ncbi:MAG: adenosylmethionine-8-amino-7-oxononanoate aminotransferase [Pedosphaera sp.]|nr:adenosylmethionine-8-amino-7-oxononanoate aminotransferase [Pedosphaera sp.]
MHKLAKLDQKYVWHPFTQMRDWLRREPIVIISGKGAALRDAHGKTYLDANASIWTNLHGHGHPKINRAIQKQLKKIAHSSALGLANEPASLLAETLIKTSVLNRTTGIRNPKLSKVFFSDDGSTAMEVALKLAYVHAQRTKRTTHPRFLSLEGAYHGDTVGAVGLGHIDLFHKAYAGLLFKTDKVLAPYCYRCPFNRARPERADAREYRKCNHECIDQVEKKFAAQKRKGNPYAAFVVEPLMQGAAGMIPQPHGWLRKVAEIVRGNGAQLIADEVMTGFGRTGVTQAGSLFACHQEGVQPDFLVVAKGLTGGYLPMAATLTTQKVFDAFLGDYSEFKTFFHGHSFTGNQLGAAAAGASMGILAEASSIRGRQRLQQDIAEGLQSLWTLPQVGDIRQVGLVTGIELVRNWKTRAPFALREKAGIRVCEAMARRGVLTRPIGNVIVIMPPYCTTQQQAGNIFAALNKSIREALGE